MHIDTDLLQEALTACGEPAGDTSFANLSTTVLPSTGGGSFKTTVQRVQSSGDEGWSVVVKRLAADENRAGWDRESDVYNDAAWLEASLPAGLRAPRLLASAHDADAITLVLEDLPSTRPTGMADLATTADLLTQFSVSAHNDGRPWWSTGRLATEFHQLADHPEQLVDARKDPAIEALRRQLLTLSTQATSMLARLEALPSRFAHLDAYSRNLLVGANGSIGLVDWAEAGLAPLGTDPATLFVWTLDYLDIDHLQIDELEAVIIDGMQRGLAATGAAHFEAACTTVFDSVVRLRHLAMMMSALPMVERRDPAVSAIVGRPLDKIIEQWLAVGDYLLSQ